MPKDKALTDADRRRGASRRCLGLWRKSSKPFQAATIYRRADRVREAQALGRLRLRQACHTYASFMIAAGVNAKALSSMGHSSIKVTFDLYGQLMPGTEAEAATLSNGYLGAQMAQGVEAARRSPATFRLRRRVAI